ncbi:hypothetical protein RHGRI_010641 [Rhododendron griersonianum]|uniref:Uncharacterized protein n=1 Tax=Rhododendron griersonianum TaxID=479676 RepID=A0AAV6KJW5_9ERIC|nr:hypothetical protein RHGRI_010641 [Rhododendron griersonianum]
MQYHGSLCSISPVGACEAPKSSSSTWRVLLSFPIQGRRVIAAVARYRRPGQLEYKAFSIFACEYADMLGLGDNLIWVVRDDFVKWLDALVHNSFIRHSTPGVKRCWYIKH